MKNYSSRREAVRRALASVTSHPTAAEIYDMVRVDMPSISLGTVYRNLAQMADADEILRITAGDGVERYDATTDEHYHFACNACGKVSDIDMPRIDGLDAMCAAATNAKVTGHSLVFRGRCAQCRKEEEQ